MPIKGRWTVRMAAGLLMMTLAGAAAATGTATLRKVRDAVVYGDDRFHCAFPSLAVLDGGEILCAFRRAPSRRALWGAKRDSHTDANSYLAAVRSRDGGETWTTAPELLFAHSFGGSQDPCLLRLSDGRLLCTSYAWAALPPDLLKTMPSVLQHPGFGFLGGYLIRSGDDGRTWEGPILPPEVPGNTSRSVLDGGPLPAYNRGALLQQRDGTILWAAARHDRVAPRLTSVHLLRSTDGGTSWSYAGPVAADPRVSHTETSLVETRDGTLAAFIRTAGNGGRAALALSRDGGRSFEPWQDLGWVGFPLHATRLSDGRIFLIYGYRENPCGIRARLIAPDLSDARTAPELVLRDDGASIDVGYPWAVELPDGRILAVYYIETGGHPCHIASTLLEVAGR